MAGTGGLCSFVCGTWGCVRVELLVRNTTVWWESKTSDLDGMWDDGSYDSADDPDTGSSAQCTDQGGTWVDPLIFEGAMNTQRGGWSPDPSTAMQDWLTPSMKINAGPGTILKAGFEFNMSLSQFISEMQQAGFNVSVLDTELGKTPFGHPGINMRQNTGTCSYHLNITPGSGVNGAPVSGSFHLDLINPLYSMTAFPSVPLSQAPLHAVFGVIPDMTSIVDRTL